MTKAKPMNALRRRMIDDMTLRNLSPATQRSYLHAVTKFSRHFGCPPDRLGLEDVRSFQVHLVSQGSRTAPLRDQSRATSQNPPDSQRGANQIQR